MNKNKSGSKNNTAVKFYKKEIYKGKRKMNEYTKRFIEKNIVEILLSIPKTVLFNFKVLPVKSAIKMPFVVSYHVRLGGVTRDNFIVEKKNLSTASMRIGFGDSANGRRESKKSLIQIANGGKIILKGTIGLSQGVVLLVNNASLVFGDHFRCNYSSTIDCTDEDIVFGNDVVLGWNVTVKNNDGHTVTQKGQRKKKAAPVYIGNHVWLCAYSTVLKGVNVGDHCVVAYGSLLTKADSENHTLYAGMPAKPVRKEINWME